MVYTYNILLFNFNDYKFMAYCKHSVNVYKDRKRKEIIWTY